MSNNHFIPKAQVETLGFRKHQQWLNDVFCSREKLPKFLWMMVCCGGGKTLLPYIALAHLRARGIAQKLIWVCPRANLRQSVAETGLSSIIRTSLGTRFQIYESANEHNPSKGGDGFVTTYQALASDSANINLFELKRNKYVIALDEAHMVAEGSLWHRALIPLVDEAEFVIAMTGSSERADGLPIAFLPYKEVENVVNR